MKKSIAKIIRSTNDNICITIKYYNYEQATVSRII